MAPNVVLIPVLGLDFSGLSTLLDITLPASKAPWKVIIIQEDDKVDHNLGDLRVLLNRHVQFAVQILTIRTSRLAFKIHQAVTSATQDTIIITER